MVQNDMSTAVMCGNSNMADVLANSMSWSCHSGASAATWWIHCHDRATLQSVRIPSAILNIVFRHILFFCSLTNGLFRIVEWTATQISYYAHVFFGRCRFAERLSASHWTRECINYSNYAVSADSAGVRQHCTGWRRINQTIYFCCPSSVFLQQNT